MEAVHFILLILIACLLGMAVGALLEGWGAHPPAAQPPGYSGGGKAKKRGRPNIPPKADAFDTPVSEVKKVFANAGVIPAASSDGPLYRDDDLADAKEVLRRVGESDDHGFSPDVVRRAETVASLRRTEFAE
jgi:hypothetical protein